MLEIGSKVQVWNGKAKMTAGGLKKKDIVKVTNKRTGVTRYKSKEQQANGKKTQKKSQKARAAWTRATKRAYKYLQKEKQNKDVRLRVTAKTAESFGGSFISMSKCPLTKSKGLTLGERLYIITKMYYDGKLK